MKLYPYQERYLATFPTSGIMHAALGSGKTAMSLIHWRNKNGWRNGYGEYEWGKPWQNKLLIVAPASKIRTGDWQEEVENWLGTAANENITYISYEKLRLNDSKTSIPNWWQFVAKRNGGIVYDIICDEAQALKNPQSKQAKAIFEIKQSGGQFIGLTGTPMSNGWIDFAGYSKLFGFVSGITEFKKTFCNITTFGGFPKIVGYNNIPVMEQQWQSISRTLTREQALELPDRQFIGKTITLSDKETKDYYTAKVARTTRTGELLDNPSLLLNYLRQTNTGSRLDALSDVLEDTEENIIVFYNYISEREAILKYIAKHHKNKKVLRYDGKVHDTLPKSDAQLKNIVLVAHYKSASTGLNLQWATVTVYFSLTYSYQEFEQSVGRTHRTGQSKKCVFYLFKAKNTVDDAIYQALRNKKDFSTKLWEAEQYASNS